MIQNEPTQLKKRYRDEMFEIVERACPLHARTEAEYSTVETPPEAVEELMERWAKLACGGDREALSRRWRWNGKSEAEIRRNLSGVAFQRSQMLPQWAELLQEVLESAPFFKTIDELRFIDPANPAPFEELFVPFIALGRREVARLSGEAYQLLTNEAHACLERALLVRLCNLAGQTLILEFQNFRTSRQPLLLFATPTALQHTSKYYHEFVESLLTGKFVAFFQEYSVLARLLATTLQFWIEATAEFLSRLSADWAEIQKDFANGQETGAVIKLVAGLSDPHQHGRSAIKLRFTSGLELFYKPRPVRMEKSFNDFLSWLNTKGANPAFKVVKVLDQIEYGWMELVPHLPCADTSAVERYYKRLGMLLCVLYALEATDCHYENVIACGEYPVLVDAETLLNPRVIDFFAATRPYDPALQAQLDLLENTVLRTAFMPFKFEQQSDSYDFGALAQITEKEVEVKVRRWEHINTDGMKLYIENGRMTPGANVPLLEGSYHDVKSYSGAFVEGFREGYRLISELKPELLNPSGVLAEFKNQPVRIIFRSTKVYGFILSKLTHPRYLRTGLERNLEIEALGHAFLLTETCPPLWHLLDEEIQAMEQDDIPFFLTTSDSRDFAITLTLSVSNCFEDSGFNQVCKRIEQFSPHDLQKQLEVIHNSLRDYLQSNPEGVTSLK